MCTTCPFEVYIGIPEDKKIKTNEMLLSFKSGQQKNKNSKARPSLIPNKIGVEIGF